MKLLTSIYSSIINLPNLLIEEVNLSEKEIEIFCKMESSSEEVCPSCENKTSKVKQEYRRKISDLRISGRKVVLHLLVRQYNCDCGRTFSECFDFVEPNKSYTKRQAKWIFELSAQQSHVQVGALLDFSHKTVERICYREVRKDKVDWSSVRRIGIDEFAFRKGHKDFITVIVDLDTHAIIDILPQRHKSFLRSYFQEVGEEICNKVESFCSDMWGPFQDLGKELFPNAKIHVDRFHWTVHLNKVLDNMRKQLRREDKENEVFKLLKWKLIKRKENLSEQEQIDISKAFECAPQLEEIYQMRNTFQAIFDNTFSFEFGKEQIEHWLIHAELINNKHLNKFIELFNRHKDNILNYFKERISTGAVEGTNNLLRTVKRFTFNMTNFLNFKYRVLAFKS